MKDNTIVTHAGNHPFENHGIVNPPVYHASTVLQHNWVLVQSGTKDEVAAAGTEAGAGADWIPLSDDRVLAKSGLLEPGWVQEVSFTVPAAGTYQFVCTFPGHNFTMFGDFEVK